MIDFKKSFRWSIASAYFEHAVNPSQAQCMSQHFGGEGNVITKEMILETYGVAAAFHWQTARDAKDAYFKAIEELE